MFFFQSLVYQSGAIECLRAKVMMTYCRSLRKSIETSENISFDMFSEVLLT